MTPDDKQGYTWAEIREMMQTYSEQDARGERPAFLPADAVKVDGEWQWEDAKLAWWWRPGEVFAHAWSKEIYVSSMMEKSST